MDVENRIRNLISDILNPFNDRISTLNKEVKSLRTNQDYCINTLASVNSKLENFSFLKDGLAKVNTDLHQVVSKLDFIILLLGSQAGNTNYLIKSQLR